MTPPRIEVWTPDPARVERELDMLADVLHATVHAGASVSFILPFSQEEAAGFWRDKVLPEVVSGGSRMLLAWSRDRIVGVVMLEPAWAPNQPHRAEVKKLLVHPEFRNQGIGRALMLALEEIARAEGRTLLTLDTRTGDKAEPLYLSLGYISAGTIPRYARAPDAPDLEATTFLYKEL